jgi:hypothetical protein
MKFLSPMKTPQEIYGSDLWKEIGKGILGRQKDEMRRKCKGWWCDKKGS